MSIDISTIKNSIKYFELISAIIGTIYFYKYKHTNLKYFLYLLWYITLTEFTARYASDHNILGFFNENNRHTNTWFYNLLRFVTFSTLFYIYTNYLSTKKYKQWIKIFAFTYIVISIFNWIFIQKFALENSEIPRIFGSIFLIATIIFYFIELLKSEKILVFHRLLLFWISVGLLLFYSGTIPFALKYNGYALIQGIHTLFLIIYILAIIMYLTFTFGFIWSKKESH